MKLEPGDASLGDMLAWLFMFKKESHILHKTRTVVVFVHLWNTLLTVIKLILNIKYFTAKVKCCVDALWNVSMCILLRCGCMMLKALYFNYTVHL